VCRSTPLPSGDHAPSGDPAVSLRGVTKSFPVGNRRTLPVLDIDELTIPSGAWTAVRGRSGSGKTTLLNLIAGIARPTTGTIAVDGTDIVALPETERDRFRARRIGYVFQTFNLLTAFSALENVMLAMTFAGLVPRRDQRRRAGDLLRRLGLEERLSHQPHRLSRGEQQRVAIARALANDPPVILADEPCASLDAATARDVLDTFLAVTREQRKTLVVVSHDDVVLKAADHVLDMAVINRNAAPAPASLESLA
jgi:ABC-type lipoprotein export system ATPase subunit